MYIPYTFIKVSLSTTITTHVFKDMKGSVVIVKNTHILQEYLISSKFIFIGYKILTVKTKIHVYTYVVMSLLIPTRDSLLTVKSLVELPSYFLITHISLSHMFLCLYPPRTTTFQSFLIRLLPHQLPVSPRPGVLCLGLL